MITFEDAVTEREFHHATAVQGGRQPVCLRVRRNGRTQTWKTRPGEFRLPVKWGIRTYDQITHNEAAQWHVASRCPRCQPAQVAQ